MRIMITGCAGPAGRALVEQLRSSEHTLVGVDMAPQHDPALSATAVVPAASDPAMLPTLRRLVRHFDIDLLIPTVSDELPQVSAAAALLLTYAPVAIAGHDGVTIAHDKYLTMAALAAAGVPVPSFSLPSAYTDTSEALEDMGGPLVLKPRVGRGGRGVRVIDRPDEVDWSTLDDALIVQEFAPGDEYAPMVHRPSLGTGDPLVVVVAKTELKEGRVGNAAAVRRVAGASVADVSEVALAAAAALDLTGPVDLDVRRTSDGRPVVLEINARFGANSESAPELLRAVLAEHSVLATTAAG